jgi:hypothetical protein
MNEKCRTFLPPNSSYWLLLMLSISGFSWFEANFLSGMVVAVAAVAEVYHA